VLLAAASGPLLTLAALAVATNKVEGLTVLKGLGISVHRAGGHVVR